MKCHKCGKEIKKGDTFCSSCGNIVPGFQRFKTQYIIIFSAIALLAIVYTINSKGVTSDDMEAYRKYADTFEAQYNGIMEEVDDYESGKIDAEELTRQFRGYSIGVESNINNMLEDISESDARNYLETTAWNLYYFSDHCADYMENGNYSELEDGLKEAENFVEMIENFKNTYLD